MLGRSLGLSSVGPVSGLPWDLSKPGVRSRALEFAMRGRPHTRVCSPICTPFRTLRVLTDCKRDPASVARELEDCVAHIEFGIELCLPQMHGRYFLLEQPAEATFRSLPRMVDLLSRGSVCRVKFDMGRYGVQSAGKPVKKPTAVVSTSFELARRLQIRCGDKMLDGPERQEHHNVMGDSKALQVYPRGLCYTICEGIAAQKKVDKASLTLTEMMSLDELEALSQVADLDIAGLDFGNVQQEAGDVLHCDGSAAFDDVSRDTLCPSMVRKALAEELQYFQAMGGSTSVPGRLNVFD